MNAPGELDAAARALIEAGREGSEPTELNRARVRRAVELKLAVSAAAGTAVLTHSQHAFGGALKLAASLAAAGAVATGAAVVIPRLGAPAPPPMTAAPVAVTPVKPERLAAPMPIASTVAPEPSATEAVRPTAPATKGARAAGLTEEIDILARANAAVNAGDGEQALRLLREYDREHRVGHLGEERAAAGVLALCEAGRVSTARKAAERFQQRWPKSPLLSRIANSCAAKR